MVDMDIETGDPLEVLRRAARLPGDVLRKVEDGLVAAEVDAIGSSRATEGGIEFVREMESNGKRIGIVSNNCAPAIHRFIQMHQLADVVPVVIGRVPRRPDLMKPHPQSLQSALKEAAAVPRRAVFIGDSVSDIEASLAIAMPCVAVANKPGKLGSFVERVQQPLCVRHVPNYFTERSVRGRLRPSLIIGDPLLMDILATVPFNAVRVQFCPRRIYIGASILQALFTTRNQP